MWQLLVQPVLTKTVLKPAKAVSMCVAHSMRSCAWQLLVQPEQSWSVLVGPAASMCTWQLLWLALEQSWSALAGPFLTLSSRGAVPMTAALAGFKTVLIGTGWTSSCHVHGTLCWCIGMEFSTERHPYIFPFSPTRHLLCECTECVPKRYQRSSILCISSAFLFDIIVLSVISIGSTTSTG